jgi:phosphatidylglycerophosphate synthase
MLMASPPRALPEVTVTAWSGLLVAVTAAVATSRAHPTSGTALLLAAVAGSLPAALCAVAVSRRRPRTATPADRVTMTRAVLASGCAAVAVLALVDAVPARTWWLVALIVPTLLLDAVDGTVARRTGTVTEAGGLLDMQVDAGVLVVLSVAAAPVVGIWVLLIGALRYVFVAASWLRPSLRRSLPRSPFRRVVAGLQGAVLTFALAPVVPVGVASVVLLLALGLLVASFAHQIVLQERQEAGLGMVTAEAPAAWRGLPLQQGQAVG